MLLLEVRCDRALEGAAAWHPIDERRNLGGGIARPHRQAAGDARERWLGPKTGQLAAAGKNTAARKASSLTKNHIEICRNGSRAFSPIVIEETQLEIVR